MVRLCSERVTNRLPVIRRCAVMAPSESRKRACVTLTHFPQKGLLAAGQVTSCLLRNSSCFKGPRLPVSSKRIAAVTLPDDALKIVMCGVYKEDKAAA